MPAYLLLTVPSPLRERGAPPSSQELTHDGPACRRILQGRALLHVGTSVPGGLQVWECTSTNWVSKRDKPQTSPNFSGFKQHRSFILHQLAICPGLRAQGRPISAPRGISWVRGWQMYFKTCTHGAGCVRRTQQGVSLGPGSLSMWPRHLAAWTSHGMAAGLQR